MTFLQDLSGRKIPALRPAHLSLFLAGLMWVVPFQLYHHAYPLTTFYQEWSAAVLGLGAMFLLLTKDYWRQGEIPRIVLLPIALMLLVVLQFALGKMAYLGQALLYTLYLMWAALLIMLGARLREELGLPAVVSVLAVFMVIGAELGAIAGLHQHFGLQRHLPSLSFLDRVVTMKVSSAVFGNVAQPNHYANYLALGLASLGLLYARGALRAWHTVLLALPIVFILPLTGSRGAWAYLAGFVALALMQRGSRLLYYSILVLLGFGLMHLVIQIPWLTPESGSVNTVQRMFAGDVSSGSIRLHIWKESWMMFAQFPLLGAGFGQFAWQHFLLSSSLHYPGVSGLYNNAHNLVMQLAAETGLAGLAVLFGTMVAWVLRVYRAENSIYHWWGYAIVGVLYIHSLLEYPLWYAYFLGIAALVLGMLDPGRYRLELATLGRVSVLSTLLLGALSLQQLYSVYGTLERLSALRPGPGDNAAYMEQFNRGLRAIQNQALLQPYANLYTSALIVVSAENLDSKLQLNGEVERFAPIGSVVYRQAMLLAQHGDDDAARAQMQRAVWSYPAEFPETENLMRQLAFKDPAHFAGLLEFALQKHEEYQRAVHTK